MSYCNNCLHRNMCEHEGFDDEAMTFCADKLDFGDYDMLLMQKDATKGDVIKDLFEVQSARYDYNGTKKMLVSFKDGSTAIFDFEWWNAPFKWRKNNEEAIEQNNSDWDDCISRKQALKEINKTVLCTTQEARKIIEELPSIRSKINDDAISRKFVKREVTNWISRFAENKADTYDLIDVLNKLPSIQPKKIGHWIDNTDLGYHVSICSNCGWMGHGDTMLIYKPNYCPHCGAKMEEK